MEFGLCPNIDVPEASGSSVLEKGCKIHGLIQQGYSGDPDDSVEI